MMILLFLGSAWAGTCTIHNQTDTAFTVESGGVSNQRLGAYTQRTLATGVLIGRSDDGRTTFSGKCSDREAMRLVKVDGVPVLMGTW